MMRVLRRISSILGIGARAFVALIGIAGITVAVANYTMTQGSGTSFGSIVVSTVHYAQMLLCDPTTPSQCGKVDTNGQQIIDVATTNNNLYAAAIAPVPFRAQNAEQTATTNGLAIPGAADLTGKPIMLPYANPENSLDGTITTAMTGTTDTVLSGMDTQGGSFRVYVTACTVSNSHATVGTDVVIKNGSAGTVLWTFPAAPAYGGAATIFPTPLKTSAATGLYAANITTGSNTKISCTGYKGI